MASPPKKPLGTIPRGQKITAGPGNLNRLLLFANRMPAYGREQHGNGLLAQLRGEPRREIFLPGKDTLMQTAFVSSVVRVAWFVGLVFGAWLLGLNSAQARPVLSSADSAFAGSVAVPLPPPGFSGSLLNSFQFQSNGVTFLFQCPSGCPVLGGSLATGGLQGLVVTVNPPVPALGFLGTAMDGSPGGTFIGTLSNEQVLLSGSGFFGAADIGEISSANLSRQGHFFRLTEMRFALPTSVPPGDADLSINKTASRATISNNQTLHYDIDVTNLGPDTAQSVHTIDFLDPALTFDTASSGGVFDSATRVVTWSSGDLPATGALSFTVDGTTPADRLDFSCSDKITNIAVTNSLTSGVDLTNNLAITTTYFDRSGIPISETCGNGIDDNCDGRFDCADPVCNCFPQLPTAGGGLICSGGLAAVPTPTGTLITNGCTLLNVVNAGASNSPQPRCDVPVVGVECGVATARLSPECCEAPPPNATDSAVQAIIQNCVAQLPAGCGVAAGFPIDPNSKESDPPTNTLGYGYTEAGRTHTYTLHYENIGTADAHDVSIIDVLPPDLDDSTLAINDGGVYDAATRTLIWRDPVLPPTTPRSVSFSINVRADAPASTRIRNSGTTIFPDAVPPSRIDTNFVEHAIVEPANPVVAAPKVIQCIETDPATHQWQVKLLNEGFAFAYNLRATILNPPASVQVTEGEASFAHPDDTDPTTRTTVIPLAITTSTDTVTFTTQTPGDPCAALTWRIHYQNLNGDILTRDVQSALDSDADGVPNAQDNCPLTFNPTQVNSDGDGVGDACDLCPADPLRTTPGEEICGDGIDQDCNGHDQACPAEEVCGNCTDDDGDGIADLLDPDCATSPLTLKRGAFSLDPRTDRDKLILNASFAAAPGTIDPATQGATVSLVDGDGVIACFTLPPGEGWKVNKKRTRWSFKDKKDDSLGDPEADERFSLEFNDKKAVYKVRTNIKEAELTDADTGNVAIGFHLGEHLIVNERAWRSRAKGKRLVTP